MKILVTLCILFFSSSAFTDVGDVYYCVEDLRIRNNEDNTDIINYKPQKFQFKRTDTKLIFGNQKNWFESAEMDIIFSARELFSAAAKDRDSDVVKYHNGKFYYSYVSFEDVTLVVASCSIF